ncbi:unnamed protein product [Sphagnum compactum]
MDAWKTTWTKRGTNMCWPQAWLPEDLGEEKVRVLSASYDFDASHWGKKGQKMQEVQKFGSSLLEQLIHKDGAWLDDSDKVVLVGHSFGGLVIKSLFVEASKHNDDKCNEFLKRTKGTIFYSVPHSGDLIAQYIKNFNKAFLQRLAGTLSNLPVFEAEMRKLLKDFEDKIETLSKDLHHAIPGIKIFSFAEQLDYNKVLVLPWDSGSKFTGNDMILDANHDDICKPSERWDPGYQKLLEILEGILGEDNNDHTSTSAVNSSTSRKDSERSMSSKR